jgi:hypothetical protein
VSDLRESVALAIHAAVCAHTPCTPGTDWTAAADAALATLPEETL